MTLLCGLWNQRKAAAGSLPAQGPAEVTELQRLFGGATQAPVQSSPPPTAVAHNSVAIRVVAAVVLGVFGWAFIAVDGAAGVFVGLVCSAIAVALVYKPIRDRVAVPARWSWRR